jgi:hypothetical protein
MSRLNGDLASQLRDPEPDPERMRFGEKNVDLCLPTDSGESAFEVTETEAKGIASTQYGLS